MTAKSDNLVWIDLEMTGLDPDRDRIIEIATIVTDSHLRILAEGPVVAIHHPDAVLERMDEWNRTTHGGSGLLERVRRSESTVRDAERVTLDFLNVHSLPSASPMCGNSICQDRRFLAREGPLTSSQDCRRHRSTWRSRTFASRSRSSSITDGRCFGLVSYFRRFCLIGNDPLGCSHE